MIKNLYIQNFALLKNVNIHFDKKCNIITGESGAGKSLIIKALKILSGDKIVKDYHFDFEIAGVFELTKEQIKKIKQLDVIDVDNELLYVKIIKKNKQVRSFINDSLVSYMTLDKIMQFLITLCGQNDNLLLNNKNYQMSLLDEFSKTQALNNEVNDIFSTYQRLKNELVEIEQKELEKEDKINYLNFVLKQFSDIKITLPEHEINERIAENEKKEKILQKGLKISHFINETNFFEKMAEFLQINGNHAFQDEFTNMKQQLNELEKTFFVLHKKIKNMDKSDTDSFLKNELNNLQLIKKKFGSISNYIEKKEQLTKQINEISELENRKKIISNLLKELESKWRKLSLELSDKRKEHVGKLEKLITNELNSLNMMHASLKIKQTINEKNLKINGIDEISFMISSNKGYDYEEISKIASGGELSRIMLSIYKILTEYSSNEILVFDEIDVGIGGETGHKIGEKIENISLHKQIICISHLPQVAIKANNHIMVYKNNDGEKTFSEVCLLNDEEINKEISRMFGDENNDNIKTYIKSLKRRTE